MSSGLLCDRHLLDTRIPASWGPVLHALSDLAAIAASGPVTSERRDAAKAAYERALALGAPLCEDQPRELEADAPEHRRWFVEAAILWMRFVEVVVADEILDTLSSRTLRRFPVDLPADETARDALRRALGRAFAIDSEGLSRMEHRLSVYASNLALKRRITACLRRALSAQGTPPAHSARLSLMKRLYGSVPIVAEEVDLVITATAILFCLPIEGRRMVGPGWDARTEVERREVEGFLDLLARANTAKTDRFPSFGAFDRARMDPKLSVELCEAIACEQGYEFLRPEVVKETLASMVSILKRSQVEQYLLHDTWGHGWQEALCDFEWPYQRLTRVSDALTPETGPYFGGEGTPCLSHAFVARGGRSELDEATLRAFAHADARGRVVAGVNGVMAELLADLVEWKFQMLARPDPTDFPSSSLLPDEVVKLDLTLSDVGEHIRWWRAPYFSLRDDPAARSRLVEALSAVGRPRPGLSEAVDRASAIMVEYLGPLFSDTFGTGVPTVDGALDVAFYERFMLNMVSLARELRAFVEPALRDAGVNRWLRPDACVDLLVVVLGWFFEQDRARFVWHLDELLRHTLRPHLLRLREALAIELAAGR